MTKDRSVEELISIWQRLDEDAQYDFINEDATAREVYRLDQAGYLNWTEIREEA